ELHESVAQGMKLEQPRTKTLSCADFYQDLLGHNEGYSNQAFHWANACRTNKLSTGGACFKSPCSNLITSQSRHRSFLRFSQDIDVGIFAEGRLLPFISLDLLRRQMLR